MIARLFRFILSSFFFALLAGIIVFAAVLSAARAPGPLSEATLVVVEKGVGTRGVASLLESRGIIPHRTVFLVSALLARNGARLQAGEYEIPPRASVMAILNQMASGRVYQRKLTVPEGRARAEILALVDKADGLAGDVPAVLPPEGALLPETYLYVRGETKSSLISRMESAMTQELDKRWASRPADFILKDKNQVLTLASIIEKETGVPSERPRVAAVFFNRLRLGMKLQSDPTVIYALTKGREPLGRALLTRDLEQTGSPYNTYMYPGLPPGPIANPGLASLQAVFAPAKTDDLYFVADGTGGHAFSKTLEEHNANVARWRDFLKKDQK